MKIVIVMDGGVIQDITANGDVEIMVIDYDCDEQDFEPCRVDQGGDAMQSFGYKLAHVYVESPEVIVDYVDGRHQVFADTAGRSC